MQTKTRPCNSQADKKHFVRNLCRINRNPFPGVAPDRTVIASPSAIPRQNVLPPNGVISIFDQLTAGVAEVLPPRRRGQRMNACPQAFSSTGSAVSSVVEHYLDTVGVTGSNPVSRTIFSCRLWPRMILRPDNSDKPAGPQNVVTTGQQPILGTTKPVLSHSRK